MPWMSARCPCHSHLREVCSKQTQLAGVASQPLLCQLLRQEVERRAVTGCDMIKQLAAQHIHGSQHTSGREAMPQEHQKWHTAQCKETDCLQCSSPALAPALWPAAQRLGRCWEGLPWFSGARPPNPGEAPPAGRCASLWHHGRQAVGGCNQLIHIAMLRGLMV